MNPEPPDSPAFGDARVPDEPVNVGPFDDKPMPVTTVGVRSIAEETLAAFTLAARSLKAAEDAYRAAQQTYAEAVKRLSEEAVR